MDVVENVVKCHTVAAMIDRALDLLPEALDAIGVNLSASRMNE